ncbi:hypothetical protein P7K49_000042 [Saguinus oedipus]|uniref:Uncharacterized protein n=1 Tax=Saguinus oedipus TaxID=9490 RepID=A0ABQ9WBE2_SAGOE|nr:hypothetical protein P7K49_000042 [Saguinus oedipus]
MAALQEKKTCSQRMQEFQHYCWNPDTGQMLGRTLSRWGRCWRRQVGWVHGGAGLRTPPPAWTGFGQGLTCLPRESEGPQSVSKAELTWHLTAEHRPWRVSTDWPHISARHRRPGPLGRKADAWASKTAQAVEASAPTSGLPNPFRETPSPLTGES